MSSRKIATIKEVAARAGVSAMTVSRVTHNPSLVAQKTREHVQTAIDELNYIPDIAAGRLSSQRSKTIAMVLPSLHFEGHARTVDALSKALRLRGFHLLIADNFYSPTEEMDLLKTILGRRPAAIVLINSAHSLAGRKLLTDAGIPVIETWDFPVRPMDSVVGFSHAEVGSALTAHLVAQGYRRIAFIGGPRDADPRGDERRIGFEATMKAGGLESTRQIVIETDHLSIAAGKRGIEQLLETHPDTDAAICLTDRVAMGALMECRRRDIGVPDELAITGHGDFDFGEHLIPPLTTTRIDAAAIGERAAELVFARLDGKRLRKGRRLHNVGFEVIARDSSLR